MTKRLTIVILAVLLLAVGLLAGCQPALFPRDLATSPYERYRTLRGQGQPAVQPNDPGRDQQVLRQRLTPLGQP